MSTQEFWNDNRDTVTILSLETAKKLAYPGCQYCQEALALAELRHQRQVPAKKCHAGYYDIIGPEDGALKRRTF